MLNNREIARVKKILKGGSKELSAVFDALSDPKRCHIFRSFLKQRELSVSDIAKVLGISMPSASQHLKILEMGNLLAREKRGREVYYALNRGSSVTRAIIKAVK